MYWNHDIQFYRYDEVQNFCVLIQKYDKSMIGSLYYKLQKTRYYILISKLQRKILTIKL